MSLYDDVGLVLKRLLVVDPFYGMFMLALDKQETTRIPTMAVGLNGINTVLYINPEFWFKMDKQEKYAVCKHEMLHLCFMHLLVMNNYPNKKLHNVATDAEINQYITSGLPKGAITLESLKKEFGVDLPTKAGADYYYKALKDKLPEEYDLGGNEHFWEEYEKLSDGEKAVIQNQIDYLIERTSEQCEKSKPGSTPGEIKSLMAFRKAPPKFDWKSHMRRWIGNSKDVFLKQTRFKPNPFFPGTPSSKVKLKQNILCIIDTSASVSNTELQEFMSEIYHIWKMGDVVTILCVDTKIYDPYEYKGQNEVPMFGRGGTYFTPSLEYFNNHTEYSCGIYFTDGYAELPPNANRPFLWVISSNGNANAIREHNGKKLKIEN